MRETSFNTTSDKTAPISEIGSAPINTTWLLMAFAVLAIMSADLLAERTLFRNNARMFYFLYMPLWNIGGAFLVTYLVQRRYATLHQRVLDEVEERQAVEESLRAFQETLEQRVQEQTADLAQLNQKLEVEIKQSDFGTQIRTALLLRLMDAQEEERNRIARELHDQMGQYLAGLNLGLESLKYSTDRGSGIRPLQELVRQIGHEVHGLSLRLRPPSLDDMGLHAALVNYIEEWSERSHVKADFQSVGLEAKRLPPHLETTVFRIVQEALTNVLKHAQASNVSLVVRHGNQEIVAVVEDDGCGFDPDGVVNCLPIDRRLGLLGIKERTDQGGGRFTIESVCGAGTTLLIRLPVPEEKTTKDHASAFEHSHAACPQAANSRR